MTATNYFVIFAKIAQDGEQGIVLDGDTVYYGGVASSFEEAEKIARDCVNKLNTQVRVVLPRVIPMEGEGTLIDAMDEAQERFEVLVRQMNESATVIAENDEKDKRRKRAKAS